MGTNSVINKILNLPERFYYPDNNRSIYSLLKETGYFEVHVDISEKAIKKVLDKYPQNVNQWLSWSENKRGGSGWYFLQNEHQKYEIGHLDPDKGIIQKKEYSDGKSGCAAFIKREIEDIRNS